MAEQSVFQRLKDKKNEIYENSRDFIVKAREKAFARQIAEKQKEKDMEAKAERFSALLSDARYAEYKQFHVECRDQFVQAWARNPSDDYSKVILFIDMLLGKPERVLKQLEELKESNRDGE